MQPHGSHGGPVLGMPAVPAFAYAARRQLWVSLVEKAYAKLYGSYEALEAGSTDEALATLTGYPCERLELRDARRRRHAAAASSKGSGDGDGGGGGSAETADPDLLWAKLLSFHEVGFLLSASVGASEVGEAEAAEAMGLLTEHAYSLLRVVDVPRAGGGVWRLVQLRNPWGKLEWRGDWSETSPLWTPALVASLGGGGGRSGDDGTFWMSFEDLLDYFRTIEACRVRPDWAEVRVRGQLPPLGPDRLRSGLGAYDLDVLETTAAEISMVQRNGRGDASHQLADLLVLVLARDTGGGLRLVECSDRQLRHCVTCEVLLPAGRYLVLPLSLRPRTGSHSASLDYVVRIGSAKPLLCEPALVGDGEAVAALAAYVKAAGKPHRAFDGMTVFSRADGAGWLSYAENRSRMGHFTVQLDQSSSFNVLPSRGSLTTYDVLPPGCGQLLQVLTHGFADDGSRMAASMQFSASPGSAEAHSPAVDHGGMHGLIELTGGGGGRAGGAPPTAGLADLLQSMGFRFL